MKLAVSNIAWSLEEDAAAFEMLRRRGIAGLEIAPPRVWPQPTTVSGEAARAYREEMAAKGFDVVAFQSLLFGKNELTLFGADAPRPCLDYLVEMGRLAARLGARVLVFGSPRNRAVPEGMPPASAWSKAVAFFSELGARYAELGIRIGLEPNPAAYQCNFIRTVEEAAQLVRAVDSPGVRLHLDAGELQMNGEAIETVVPPHLDITAHVHASEPMLAPLQTAWDGHRRLAAVLKAGGYDGWVSLEMKRPEAGLPAVEQAIGHLRELYA